MNEKGKVTPPRKILVVEDENLIAMEIQDRLKKLGYDAPVTTPSGEEGIKLAKTVKGALDKAKLKIQQVSEEAQDVFSLEDFSPE